MPEVTNKKVCRQIMETLNSLFKVSHLGNWQLAYDGGKSAYTAGPLPFSSKDFIVKLVDMSARSFYEPILVSEFVRKYFNREPSRILSDQDRVKVKKALKGVRVEFSHREYVRRYKVLSISTQPMSQLKWLGFHGS